MRPAVLFTVAATAAWAAGHLADPLPDIAALLIAAFAFAAVCAGALALPGYRQDLKVLSALALSVRRTRGSA